MFLTFRDATGAASAVQSLNYHLMELVLYGYDSRKAEVYQRFPHLSRLLSAESRDQRCLREAVRDSGLRGLQEAFARTDAALLTWRDGTMASAAVTSRTSRDPAERRERDI
ncbi:hypothetical protein NKG94_03655 [Micromonospora sp. M12]